MPKAKPEPPPIPRLSLRVSREEFEAIKALCAATGENSWGAATRRAAAALGNHYASLEVAARDFQDSLGTAADGARLVKRVLLLLREARPEQERK